MPTSCAPSSPPPPSTNAVVIRPPAQPRLMTRPSEANCSNGRW
jgi:hypothetical protein